MRRETVRWWRRRKRRRCPNALVTDRGQVTHYCLLPKGHSGPHANGFSQVAWVEDYDTVTYYGASYVRVSRGGSWLPLEHLPSDPDAPPIKVTVGIGRSDNNTPAATRTTPDSAVSGRTRGDQ